MRLPLLRGRLRPREAKCNTLLPLGVNVAAVASRLWPLSISRRPPASTQHRSHSALAPGKPAVAARAPARTWSIAPSIAAPRLASPEGACIRPETRPLQADSRDRAAVARL